MFTKLTIRSCIHSRISSWFSGRRSACPYARRRCAWWPGRRRAGRSNCWTSRSWGRTPSREDSSAAKVRIQCTSLSYLVLGLFASEGGFPVDSTISNSLLPIYHHSRICTMNFCVWIYCSYSLQTSGNQENETFRHNSHLFCDSYSTFFHFLKCINITFWSKSVQNLTDEIVFPSSKYLHWVFLSV